MKNAPINLASHINAYNTADIHRMALFTIVHDAIRLDPEASFLSPDEMYDLALDRTYKHGPTDFEVGAMLYYFYNHNFRVVFNGSSGFYDMMPPASFKDEADIAKAMYDMYGLSTHPVTFA